MKAMDYIGFKLEELLSVLEAQNKSYKIIETWDTKGTKIGNDVRIVNIKDKETLEIYVAYF